MRTTQGLFAAFAIATGACSTVFDGDEGPEPPVPDAAVETINFGIDAEVDDAAVALDGAVDDALVVDDPDGGADTDGDTDNDDGDGHTDTDDGDTNDDDDSDTDDSVDIDEVDVYVDTDDDINADDDDIGTDYDDVDTDDDVDDDKEEVLKFGKSATKRPQSYVFYVNGVRIRLIDTPGICDTDGLEQDQKNLDSILSYLTHYEEIHAICILLKPNSSRLTAMFRFCIQELLVQLHSSAKHNIVFCFTNARATFYQPGDTLPALNKMLREQTTLEL